MSSMSNMSNIKKGCGLVSIIIIFIILALIYYKIKQIEGFDLSIDRATAIINNNSIIEAQIKQLDSLYNLSGLVSYDPNAIDTALQTKIQSNIGLLETPKITFYNSNVSIISSKVATLKSQLESLEKSIHNMNYNNVSTKKYISVKSMDNGMDINLLKASNTGAYMVNINNGCLSVGATDYNVYACNDKNSKQYFNMQHIVDSNSYLANIDNKTIDDNNNDPQLQKPNYPFVLMKSLNNENCLTNNNGNITVQPCSSYVAQRWMPNEYSQCKM